MSSTFMAPESKGIIMTDTCGPITVMLKRPSNCAPVKRVKALKASSRAISGEALSPDLAFACLLILDGWCLGERFKSPAWVIDHPIDMPSDCAPGYLTQAAACLTRARQHYDISMDRSVIRCFKRS